MQGVGRSEYPAAKLLEKKKKISKIVRKSFSSGLIHFKRVSLLDLLGMQRRQAYLVVIFSS